MAKLDRSVGDLAFDVICVAAVGAVVAFCALRGCSAHASERGRVSRDEGTHPTQCSTVPQRGGYYQPTRPQYIVGPPPTAQPSTRPAPVQDVLPGPAPVQNLTPGPMGPPGPRGPAGPAPDLDELAADVANRLDPAAITAAINLDELKRRFEPLRITEIDYDVLVAKLAVLVEADIRAGKLPELQPPAAPTNPPAPAAGAWDGLAPAAAFALRALGIGTGSSLPLWAIGLIVRHLWRSRRGGPPRPHGAAPTPTAAAPSAPTDGAACTPPDGAPGQYQPVPMPPRYQPVPIAVDAPPSPQFRSVETRFAPFERDTYAQAHAWSKEQLVRRYPGAVDVLESEAALINQYMAGVAPAAT